MQEKLGKTKTDLNGKTVLVTGAAGFIGSFLSKRLLTEFEDIRVIGFDSVNDYYDVRLKESRLEELRRYENFTFIKANLADKSKVGEVFCEYAPQIVNFILHFKKINPALRQAQGIFYRTVPHVSQIFRP